MTPSDRNMYFTLSTFKYKSCLVITNNNIVCYWRIMLEIVINRLIYVCITIVQQSVKANYREKILSGTFNNNRTIYLFVSQL